MDRPFPHVEGVTHRFVKANGVTQHVAQAGAGEPLLMLHGWPQHWSMWRHQIAPLAQHYTVICPDLRGFGWSDAPAGGYEKERLADDVIALADALDLRRVRLMAHDWGAWVGFLVCLREPGRIERYLALNAPHPFQKLDSRVLHLWRFWYQCVIASPLLGKRAVQREDGLLRLLLRHPFVSRTPAADEMATFIDQFREPERARASTLIYRTFLLRELLPVLCGRYRKSYLSTPTLILFGARDLAISPRLLEGWEGHAGNLTIELVPDCGHFIAEDRPELVTKRALEFFNR